MVTFGSGRGFQGAQRRLAEEAASTGLFDHIYNYSSFPAFVTRDKRWKRHLKVRTGAGYWFWKASLVRNLLANTMKAGDVLVYLDAGSELGNSTNFLEVARHLCNHDLLAFSLGTREEQFTKGDLFERFGVSTSDPVYATPQLLATYFAIRNTPASRKFVANWEKLAADIHLIGDDPSKAPNSPIFKEHRRDQSLFSMLVKANQPEIAEDQREKYPYAANATRHPEFGVQGFRPYVAKDPGYPQDPDRRWISASRNHEGTRLKGAPPKRLSHDEAAAIRRKLTEC